MVTRRARRLFDEDPESLDEEDLDILLGGATEEIDRIESELESLDTVRDRLIKTRATLQGLNGRAKAARNDRAGRDNGNA
jgi:hypothetical protein